jgi:hypothetical protein
MTEGLALIFLRTHRIMRKVIAVLSLYLSFKVRFMFRIGLVIYLTIASLAGPAWCCCLFDRLPLPTVMAASADEAKESSTPARSCCCQRQTTPEQPATNPTKSEEPTAPDDRCPCKDQRSNDNVPIANDVQIQEQQFRSTLGSFDHLLAMQFSCMHIDHSIFALDKRFDPSGPHRLSGPDLLCALQNFRC